MEKFGLIDKTKEELIDIALEKEAAEKELRAELEKVDAQLARAKNELKRREKSMCTLCIICMMLMILTTFFVFYR